jgi:hypothetical protein
MAILVLARSWRAPDRRAPSMRRVGVGSRPALHLGDDSVEFAHEEVADG